MFCPQCKSEYQEGVVICADCQVPLVNKRQQESELGSAGYEEILATNNEADIAIIKSLFDSEGIGYYFLGEHFAFPIRLMVDHNHVEEARALLQDLFASSVDNKSDDDLEETKET
jgi:hypothetical protein